MYTHYMFVWMVSCFQIMNHKLTPSPHYQTDMGLLRGRGNGPGLPESNCDDGGGHLSDWSAVVTSSDLSTGHAQ